MARDRHRDITKGLRLSSEEVRYIRDRDRLRSKDRQDMDRGRQVMGKGRPNKDLRDMGRGRPNKDLRELGRGRHGNKGHLDMGKGHLRNKEAQDMDKGHLDMGKGRRPNKDLRDMGRGRHGNRDHLRSKGHQDMGKGRLSNKDPQDMDKDLLVLKEAQDMGKGPHHSKGLQDMDRDRPGRDHLRNKGHLGMVKDRLHRDLRVMARDLQVWAKGLQVLARGHPLVSRGLLVLARVNLEVLDMGQMGRNRPGADRHLDMGKDRPSKGHRKERHLDMGKERHLDMGKGRLNKVHRKERHRFNAEVQCTLGPNKDNKGHQDMAGQVWLWVGRSLLLPVRALLPPMEARNNSGPRDLLPHKGVVPDGKGNSLSHLLARVLANLCLLLVPRMALRVLRKPQGGSNWRRIKAMLSPSVITLFVWLGLRVFHAIWLRRRSTSGCQRIRAIRRVCSAMEIVSALDRVCGRVLLKERDI
jgi:hypothetical protein